MRPSLYSNLRPFAACATAIILAALCWHDATSALADPRRSGASLPPLPEQKPHKGTDFAEKPKAIGERRQLLVRRNGKLGHSDEIATLHAIHAALSSVGDGGAYVWRRGNGRLTGLFRPTTSFKSSNGDICRHIIIRLNSERYSREAEGIACRDASGTWSLAG